MHDFLILLLETTVINTKLLIALEKLWMTELQRTRAIADAAVFNECEDNRKKQFVSIKRE